MKPKKLNQRGQALVMIALAIVGLAGFTALAIDGGNVFSDRRHSQNASDAASLAAALAITRNETDWRDLGYQRAVDNGYDPSDGVTAIDVYMCNELPQTVSGFTLTCDGKGLPAGADPAEYVYVHIKSRVKLFFAPIIGWKEVINHTDAVARAKKEEETAWFPGYAIVSTMTDCPSHYPHDPFTVTGNSGTTIVDAGILVNSTCTSPQPAYDQGGSSSVETDTGVCVVGAAQYTDTIPPPTTNCNQIDVSKYVLPNPTCSQEGKIEKINGEWWAWPGLYGSNFNFDSIDDVTPSGTLKLQKGIYCFYDGIDLNSTWTITTDLDGQGDYDSASEGVFFFVPGGDITFNGSSTINIHAIDSTIDNFPEEFVNYLIYVPPTNDATVKITGANGSQYTGTILAPSSYLVLNGGSGTVGLDSQLIGYSVAIEGNGTLDIHYKATSNATTTTNPGLEQTE
jgi:hypothetical protein